MNFTSRRWFWVGVASVVLNVFLIGFVAGRQAFGPSGCSSRSFGPGGQMGRGHGPLRDRLSEGSRVELRRHLGDVRRAREQVRQVLLVEPFDPAKLDAALTVLRERSAALSLQMHRDLLETARGLTPEERRKLADSRFLRRAARMPD
jgi:uncharacterized membrane protein